MAAAINNSIGGGGLGLGSTSKSTAATTTSLLKPQLKFPPRHQFQFQYPTLYSTRSNPDHRLCSSTSDSNSFSFNFNLKDLSHCLSFLQIKESDYDTKEGFASALEHTKKAEPFLRLFVGQFYCITLRIVLREDDDGMVKKKLNKISTVFNYWDNSILVHEFDPDRQYFLKSALKDVSKCLLENADHWIYGFSNVSKTASQLAEYSTNCRKPLELSSTENTKHEIGCSQLYLQLSAEGGVISFSDKGIHTRQDVETLLQQYMALQGNIIGMRLSHKSFKFDKEKVDQVQGYHHVNRGDYL